MLVRRIDDLADRERPLDLNFQTSLFAHLAASGISKRLEDPDFAAGQHPLAPVRVLSASPQEDSPSFVRDEDGAAYAGLCRGWHHGSAHRSAHLGGMVGRIVPTVPDSIGFVYEDDLVRVTDVPRSTRQNWAKPNHSLVEEPDDGQYREKDVIETVCVAELVRALKKLGDVSRVWSAARDTVLEACAGVSEGDYLVALVEKRSLRLTLARSHEELGRALRPFEAAIAVPLASRVADARADFWRFAVKENPAPDKRRRAAFVGRWSGAGRSNVTRE